MKHLIVVRNMELKDVDFVVNIEKDCFSIPWTKNAFIAEIKGNKLAKYCVAEVDSEVVGYGGMWLIIDEAHITNIAVHSKYRSIGVGQNIVKYLIEEGQKINIEKMTLEVRRSNLIAQSLYKKFGFIPCGVRVEYYQDDGEDAIIMCKGF